MARYTPIDAGVAIQQDQCDLAALEWSSDRLTAIFSCGPEAIKASRAVSVTFGWVVGHRALEEMVHSIYGENGVERTAPGTFAYTVEDSTFAPFLAGLAKHYPPSCGTLTHYVLVSQGTVLDVLSFEAPCFEEIDYRYSDRIR